MASDLKYVVQKNRNKIFTIGAILLFLVVLVGGYFFLQKKGYLDHVTDIAKTEHQMIQTILSATEKGSISLINTENNEVLDSISLPDGTYVYQMNKEHNTLYAYNGSTVYEVKNKKNQLIHSEWVKDLNVKDYEAIRVDGSNIAILSDKAQSLTFRYVDGKNEQIHQTSVKDEVKAFNVIKDQFIYADNRSVYVFSPKQSHTMELGEETTSILALKENILLHNQFGKGLQNSILLQVNPDNLQIEELKETKAEGVNVLKSLPSENTVYTTQYIKEETPYYLLHIWNVENGSLQKDEAMSIRIPVKEDAISYTSENTVVLNGYLYTHDFDFVQIFDTHSQSIVKKVKTSEDFAAPIVSK